MNREIKFKAFVRGYMVDVVSIDFVNKYITWDDNQYDRCDPPNKCFEMASFEDIKLLEYTGLKDKKGKKIFEGDYNKYYEVVIWCERCVGWQFGLYDIPTKDFINCHNCEGNFMFQDVSEFQTTGNIYEPHELLESDQK